MLDPKSIEPIADIDIADAPGVRERWLRTDRENESAIEGPLIARQTTGPTSGHATLVERHRLVLHLPSEGAEDEEESRYLVLKVQRNRSALDDPETTRSEQPLSDHSEQVAKHVERIADSLGLMPLREVLTEAAVWHDRGKDRPVWQRYACNTNSEPLAKSRKYLHWSALGGYRHELGSLLEAAADDGLNNIPEADLILHLIAAHHGWGRPHFEPRSWDHTRTTADNEAASHEAMRRFGRLQQRFGRWGLAWLESLLRCADITASKASAEATAPSQLQEVRP